MALDFRGVFGSLNEFVVDLLFFGCGFCCNLTNITVPFNVTSLTRTNSPRESRIDNRLESAVLVEGPGSVHVLFNYLLTSKTTISTSGSHAGLPPTILSPLGFRGATLRSLKVNLARQKLLISAVSPTQYSEMH